MVPPPDDGEELVVVERHVQAEASQVNPLPQLDADTL